MGVGGLKPIHASVFRFNPPRPPWLNRIEPGWKTLRWLALKGQRFEDAAEIARAIADANRSWNPPRKPCVWRKAVP